MWKPSKPVSLADFMAGATNFEGMTLFEELPGTSISEVSRSKKLVKKKKVTKSKNSKKSAELDDAPALDIEDHAGGETPARTKKKRKNKQVERSDDVSAPPPKKRRKKTPVGQPAAAESTAEPSLPDPAAAIEASGADVSNWEVLHVPPELLAALAELKFEQPTEIQRLCLPAAIRGRMDVVGAAETGSGKTLAFGLPLLYGVMKERQRELKAAGNAQNEEASDEETASDELNLQPPITPVGPKALILAPTRELAIQVKNHIVAVAKYTGVKVVTVVGGMSEQKQERLLSRRPDVVVATPGRLWEFVEAGHPYFQNLSLIRFLVVDETDRMLEKGHFQQLHLLLERINGDSERAASRQNFVFSATLTLSQEPAHRDVRQLKQLNAQQKLKHITAMIGIREKNKKVVDITRSLGTAASLTEMAVSCTIPEKDELLYYFALQHPGRTLVFCNSIDCVTRLGRLLTLLELQPLLLHASMQQRQRLKSLQRFQSRPRALLVATDVAARGLDVPDVQHVIHYQVPRTTDAYVHRSGRTARALSEGLSVMFVEPTELAAYRKLLRQLDRESDLPAFSLDSDVLRQLARHVQLARDINLAEHRQRRAAGSSSWARRAAEQMDMELDDDMLPERDEEAERKVQNEVRARRAQLKDMLKRRDQVWLPYTQHGRLKVPAKNVSALSVAKASTGKKTSVTPPVDPSLESTPAPPESPTPAAKPTVAPPADGGDSAKLGQKRKKAKRKALPPAVTADKGKASTTATNEGKTSISAKRRKKKKWFARKGKKA